MNIVHLAAECAPLAKVGGLGDVVGALPKFQNALGETASVVLPRYGSLRVSSNRLSRLHDGAIVYGEQQLTYSIWLMPPQHLGFTVYLVDEPVHFGYQGIYQDERTGLDFENQADRFFVFQLCALDFLKKRVVKVDLLHVHDHHTALVPVLLKDDPNYRSLKGCRTVFTVHSAEHQGVYPWSKWEALGVRASAPETMRRNGQLNSMKAALYAAGAVTTVSPSYAEELRTQEESANGLMEAFQDVEEKTEGILNGIDPDVWSPQADALIPYRYDLDTLENKQKNKAALCAELGLNDAYPLFTFIGRLMKEKGVELLPEAVERFLKQDPSVSVVILGTGHPDYEGLLNDLAERLNEAEPEKRLEVRLEFNNTLAHQLYAASDALLMPSRVEPCGLNQMYALTYGTIPVVHAVGGLRDTVQGWDPATGTGNGFRFEAFSTDAFLESLKACLKAYRTPVTWVQLVEHAMQQDWSWTKSATHYLDLYHALLPARS